MQVDKLPNGELSMAHPNGVTVTLKNYRGDLGKGEDALKEALKLTTAFKPSIGSEPGRVEAQG